MSLFAGGTNKAIKRFTHILRVLTKHGFGFMLQRLPLSQWLPFVGRVKKEARLDESHPKSLIARRVVLALEELGPTFVKFGQILSNRSDLLPPEYIEELKTLQDRVAPFEAEKALAIIESEFGRPMAEIFEHFEPTAFASGSIAQVHNARTADGTDVVVKIKRPGIDAVITSDLILLYRLAELFEKYIPEIAALRPKLIVEEFDRAIREELDILAEASHTAKFKSYFEENDSVRIPDVFWDYTSKSVLTLERLSGTKISDAENLEKLGINKEALARNLLRTFMDQYFKLGFFHADPHPGNILVDEDGTIGLLDFGTVGHLDYELKSRLASTLFALVNDDVDEILRIYEELGVLAKGVNTEQLKPDVLALVDKYYGMPLERIDLKQLLNEFLAISRRYKIMLRRDFVLLGKSFVLVATTARDLDPHIDAAEMIKPYARELLREKYSSQRLYLVFQKSVSDLGEIITKAPRQLGRLLRKVLNDEIEIAFRHENLERLITEMDRSSNRLSFSILIAAIIVASSLIIQAKIQPLIFGNVSLLGLIGYLFAGMLGMALAIAMWRSGKL